MNQNFGSYQDRRTWNCSKNQQMEAMRDLAKRSASQFYAAEVKALMIRENEFDSQDFALNLRTLGAEATWWGLGRPYYNVWPVMLDALAKFPVERLPIKALADWDSPPDQLYIEVRFPRGTIEGCESVLIGYFWDEGNNWIHAVIGHDWRLAGDIQEYREFTLAWSDERKDEPVKEGLEGIIGSQFEAPIRLALSCYALQSDKSIVEPCVLSKDRNRWEGGDAELRAMLEERAARRRGGRLGFDLGRVCEVNPHWRRPHPALYWTGPGRTIPKMVVRAGSVVNRKRAKDVPSGWRESE